MHIVARLLEDLATLALNTAHLPDQPQYHFTVATQPSPVQRRASSGSTRIQLKCSQYASRSNGANG